MLALMATSAHGFLASSGSVTARIDSLFVRTSSPRRSLMLGSEPLCLSVASSSPVPSAPPAKTTPRAVKVRRRLKNHAPGRSVVTTYPSLPSAAPSGRTSTTLCSASTVAPFFSANQR